MNTIRTLVLNIERGELVADRNIAVVGHSGPLSIAEVASYVGVNVNDLVNVNVNRGMISAEVRNAAAYTVVYAA